VVTAGVLCLLLAILFDLVLLGIQRLLTPWMRALPMERRRRWMLWRTNEAVTA
jgi:osmoprotectant transport system permease protein